MAQTFLHWGLHPWAAYAVIGLAIHKTIGFRVPERSEIQGIDLAARSRARRPRSARGRRGSSSPERTTSRAVAGTPAAAPTRWGT